MTDSALWTVADPHSLFQDSYAMRAQSLARSGASLAALAATHLPPAICGRPQANAEAANIIKELRDKFQSFQAKHEGELATMQAAVDQMAVTAALRGVTPNGDDEAPPDPEYSELFAGYFRSGQGEAEVRAQNHTGRREIIRAAMSVGSDTAGGYLAPVEWDRKVNKALATVSPMRRIANVVPTTVRAFTTLWQAGGWGSGWVGEEASRPATVTPTLQPVLFPNGEIYAFPQVTQQLLDDADFKVEDWLASEVETEFGLQESVAFLAGNGTNKPRGFLTYTPGGASDGVHPGGNLIVVPSGQAAALPAPDGLVDFVYGLPSPYRQNARWLMNSMTAATVAKLKDGDGNYLWRETYVAGQPATLLGYPVEIDENMPSVGAGTLPIAFGDFNRGYLINDRLGIQVLRDPLTNKPFVGFYTRKRVGGGVWDPKAIRLMRIAAS